MIYRGKKISKATECNVNAKKKKAGESVLISDEVEGTLKKVKHEVQEFFKFSNETYHL